MAAAATQAKHTSLNGVDLEYWEGGQGPTVLALHGFLETPGWQDYHARLAEHFRVIAPAHPGFGGSSRPDWMLSIGDLAYFYLDLLEQQGFDRASLIGHSLGGWIAAEMAVRSTQRLRRLVLVDAVGLPAPGGPVRPAGGSIADWLVLEPEKLRPLAWHDPSSDDRLKLPGEEATSDEELAAMLRNREAATVYGWKPFFHNPQLGHWLHRVNIPALVVWGQHDGVVPLTIGQAYADGIPNARLLLMPNAAHLPHLEQPAEFAGVATDFLSQD